MARQFGALPRAELAGHLTAQGIDPVVKLFQLLARLWIVARDRLQLLNLFLDPFQLGLCF